MTGDECLSCRVLRAASAGVGLQRAPARSTAGNGLGAGALAVVRLILAAILALTASLAHALSLQVGDSAENGLLFPSSLVLEFAAAQNGANDDCELKA